MARREGLKALDLKVDYSEKVTFITAHFLAMDVSKPTAEIIPEIIGIVFEFN